MRCGFYGKRQELGGEGNGSTVTRERRVDGPQNLINSVNRHRLRWLTTSIVFQESLRDIERGRLSALPGQCKPVGGSVGCEARGSWTTAGLAITALI